MADYSGITQMPFSASQVPPMLSQSVGPDATLTELEPLDAPLEPLEAPLASLGSLGSLGELAELFEEAAEPPSEACAIDRVVKAGAAYAAAATPPMRASILRRERSVSLSDMVILSLSLFRHTQAQPPASLITCCQR